MMVSAGQVYKNEGWQKWAHWLDTTTVGGAKLDVLPFADALKFVWKLKLTNQEKWYRAFAFAPPLLYRVFAPYLETTS